MSIYCVYIISESGSLQFYYDHLDTYIEIEKTFDYPLPFQFKNSSGRLVIDFGSMDDIKPGYSVISVNSTSNNGLIMENDKDLLKLFSKKENFPLTIKFGRPRLRPNDRLNLAGMFHPIYQMTKCFSPFPDPKFVMNSSESGEKKSNPIWNTGIQTLETLSMRVHCFESIIGVKFIMVTDFKLPVVARDSLKRIYEAYTDYVLKNPFFHPNQPFNFEFFTNQVKLICDQSERGIYNQM